LNITRFCTTLARGAACVAWLGTASAAPDERIASLAAKEKPALLETLKQLVSIESGSRDLEGLDKIAK
jgi:glutamate carboxypeptidase